MPIDAVLEARTASDGGTAVFNVLYSGNRHTIAFTVEALRGFLLLASGALSECDRLRRQTGEPPQHLFVETCNFSLSQDGTFLTLLIRLPGGGEMQFGLRPDVILSARDAMREARLMREQGHE